MHTSLLRRTLVNLQADTCLACSTSRRYASKGSWEWRREKTPWRNVELWNHEPPPPKERKRPIGRPRKVRPPDDLIPVPKEPKPKMAAPKEPKPKVERKRKEEVKPTRLTRKEIKLAKERGEIPAILPPTRPPTAFANFMIQFYKDWQDREGRGSFAVVGQAWRQLPEEEREKYYDAAEWEEYRRKMDEYLRVTSGSTDMTKKTTPYILFRAEKLTEMGHDGTRESLQAKSPIIAKAWQTLPSEEKDKYGDPEEWEEYHRMRDRWTSSKYRTNTRTPYIIFRSEKLKEMGHDGSRESLVEKSQILVKKWKRLSDAERDPYVKAAAEQRDSIES